MTPDNRSRLDHRVRLAAEAALAAKNYASALDVLIGMGWLAPDKADAWRRNDIDYLERVVGANLARISMAMHLFRSWATKEGLVPRESAYVARRPGRPALRFSKSGEPNIERQYRTHWVSPTLREAARARRTGDANQPAAPARPRRA